MKILSKIKFLIPPRFFLRLWYHRARAWCWAIIYRFPGRRIPVIGITGTDGKTTTTEMTAHIFRKSGIRVASASTIAYHFGDKTIAPPTKKTSQDCREINRFLHKAIQEKCQIAILEISSVALDQGRSNGVNFTAAGLTNITPEELRYHGDFEKYRQAKKLLFQETRNSHVFPAQKEFQDFAQLPAQKRIIWSTGTSQNFINSEVLLAEKINTAADKSTFSIRDVGFTLPLPSDFNIENALVAIGLALSQGITLQQCTKALKSFTTVPGRLQPITNKRGLYIFVDYALTPNALERLLQANKKNFPESKIWIIFGCAGGGRDRSKRPILGQIAAQNADHVIITDDESYDEKTEDIIKEIYEGIPKDLLDKVRQIPDRREAISYALKNAKPKDVILIPGMGAETIRNISGTETPWSDAQEIKEELIKLN